MKPVHTFLAFCAISLGISTPAAVPETFQEKIVGMTDQRELMAPNFISRTDSGDETVLKSAQTAVNINRKTLEIMVSRDGRTRRILPPEAMTVEYRGTEFQVSPSAAGKVTVGDEHLAGYRGVVLTLEKFKRPDGYPGDLTVTLAVGIEWFTGDVLCELRPDEKTDKLKRAVWPGAFDGNAVDATIIPHMQGLMIPRSWPEKFNAPYNDAKELGLVYGRSLYMPWWGVTAADSSAMMLLETPVDGGCHFRHDPQTGTLVSPVWIHTMGRMEYSRKIRIVMLNGDYNAMAKYYRTFLKSRGKFISLPEKIAATPSVADLIGSPILHTTVAFYGARDKHSHLTTFAEHENILRQYHATGLRKLYVHFDGIGVRGYDNLEPDQLPVNVNAGGVAGARKLLELCRKLNYRTVFHQQYRDFYTDAVSFDTRHLAVNQFGYNHYDDIWAGGKNGILCPSKSLDYVRRNNELLAASGISPDGCYLDVFAVVPADECYAPAHRVNRTECYRMRGECFDYIRAKFGIVSSEEPVDWAVPYLHLTHHAPWAVDAKDRAFGIMLPLFNLVYHDAIFTPFETGLKRDSYYYPVAEIPFLYCLLNAGMPYLAKTPDKTNLEAVRIAAELHRRVALQEQTGHKLLDIDGTRQSSVYADGTVVTVNRQTGDWEIRYPDRTQSGNALKMGKKQ